MLAALTKVSEFGINELQAKTLGTAIANVARHYDVSGVNQKTLDWFNLAQVCGLVYGPVIGRAINTRRAARANAPQQAQQPGEAPADFYPPGAMDGPVQVDMRFPQ